MMESQLGIGQLKKQATFFLRDKIKAARLAFTDVTPAQLLTEEATNSEEWGPETKVMSEIADAARMSENCMKIMQVLRQRLETPGGKYWRQLNKTLILLEYLLTHGPPDIVGEISCDRDAVEELTRFEFLDEKGFDRGSLVRKKASRVLELITEGNFLKEEREHALKVSQKILGFSSGSGALVSSIEVCLHQKHHAFDTFDGGKSSLLQGESGNVDRDLPNSSKGQLDIHCHPLEKATRSSDCLDFDWHPFESSDSSTPCMSSEWRPFEDESAAQTSHIQSGSERGTHDRDHLVTSLEFAARSMIPSVWSPQVNGSGKDGDNSQTSLKVFLTPRAGDVSGVPDLIDL